MHLVEYIICIVRTTCPKYISDIFSWQLIAIVLSLGTLLFFLNSIFKVFQQLYEAYNRKEDGRWQQLLLLDDHYINTEAALPTDHICEHLPALRVNYECTIDRCWKQDGYTMINQLCIWCVCTNIRYSGIPLSSEKYNKSATELQVQICRND